MKQNQVKFRKFLLVCLLVMMTVQIVLGFAWMAVNLTNIPLFGDSTEYYELSQSLQVDEYRPLLYPLIIRMADTAAKHLPIAYQTLVYLVQTVICILSVWFLAEQLGGILFPVQKKRGTALFHAAAFFVSLYITCIPLITFMNFSVLTDSIATSMLLLMIGALIRIFHVSETDWKNYLVIAVSMLVEYTIRADRLYTCTLFLVISFGIWLFRQRKKAFFKRCLALSLAAVLVSTGAATAFNKATQHPGIYGRISTTLGFVLLDRVVWPNMAQNYDDFSDEIKGLITREDAETFDGHNNNVMYQMAPLLREKAGVERTEELYKEMAAVVFKNQPGKVIFDILEDITCVIFTPVSAFLSVYELAETADDWNLYCVSRSSETLSNMFYQYYLHTFLLLFLAGWLLLILKRVKRAAGSTKKENGIIISQLLAPGFLLCVIIALWFSIGDGAPPNDRYAMLHYVIWTFWALGVCFGGICGRKSKSKK